MNPNILALDQFPPCTTSLHCNETSQFNTQNYMYVITKICSCTLQDNRATFTLTCFNYETVFAYRLTFQSCYLGESPPYQLGRGEDVAY